MPELGSQVQSQKHASAFISKRRQFIANDVPNNIRINPSIIVRQLVSKRCDSRPINGRNGLFNAGIEAFNVFTNRNEQIQGCVKVKLGFRIKKRVCRLKSSGINRYLRPCFKNRKQIQCISIKFQSYLPEYPHQSRGAESRDTPDPLCDSTTWLKMP